MQEEKIQEIKKKLEVILASPFNTKHFLQTITNELREAITSSRSLASSEEEMMLMEEGVIANLKSALDYMESLEGNDASEKSHIAETTVHRNVQEALSFFENLNNG